MPNAKRDHIQGPIDAPLALVEYGDYECPYCGEAYPILKAVQEAAGRPAVLCLSQLPAGQFTSACATRRRSGRSGGSQGKFWEMHDVLFENQDALEDENIVQYAEALGLDARRLIGEVLNGTHTARVREDFRSGARGGVNALQLFSSTAWRYEGALEATAAA